MGALLTLQEPTPDMTKEAASAGFYHSPWGTKHPKIQLLTAEQLLAGRGLSYPAPGQTNMGLRKAPRTEPRTQQQPLPGIAKTQVRYKQRRKRL
jgi:site-specific DNA-methyltransferase (adenine-specific)